MELDGSPRIVWGRVVMYPKPGSACYQANISVEFCRQVVLLFERMVAGHVVEYLECAFIRCEASLEDIGMRYVGLPHGVPIRYVEPERTAFRAV